MRTTRWFLTVMALLVVAPAAWASHEGALDVELWTDRGNDAVYQPGDAMQVRVRASEDGYLLVYEIDAEGYVRLLWPDRGSRGFIEGRQTLEVPSDRSNLELVVEGATGQGYLVALVAREPFRDLPWYLRPYDAQAEGTGYEGDPDDEEGITRQGQVVGDPFVAMERIRRHVLDDPESADAFGTAYTTYYVHERVRYPRYLCNDCHRPGYWAWWDGFDPYYASCSAFDFRVNWGWYWGPTYWFGTVPYYYYTVRHDCPPRYRLYSSHGAYSSWNGWRSWRNLMGGSVRRYKSPPPPGYEPPSKYKDRGRASDRVPPGLLVGREVAPGRHGGGLRPTQDAQGPRPRDDARRPGVRDGGERVERPRDVSRGVLIRRPSDPGRGRADGNDREPSGNLRGNPNRQGDGGMKWVGRGRAEADPRPRDERAREERPSFRRPPVEYGRGGESRREAPQRREVQPQQPRRESPRAESKKEERRNDDEQRAPESKPERRSDSRGGERGREGRPNR